MKACLAWELIFMVPPASNTDDLPMADMTPRDFSQFPQPESNESNTIQDALEALRTAHNLDSANEAYDRFLWSVGNNHSGTFYPVVLAVLPQIEQILTNSGGWAQRAAMESLIDLCGSFVPESGHEVYLGLSVQEALQAFAHSMRPRVAHLVNGTGALSKSASDLLELIDDQVA